MPNHHSYLGIVGYCITQDWERKSLTLKNIPSVESHIGENILEKVKYSLKE